MVIGIVSVGMEGGGHGDHFVTIYSIVVEEPLHFFRNLEET